MRLQAKALLLIWTCAMLLLSGCMFGDPPLPLVAAGKTKVPVTQNSYCWGNKCADYADAKSQLEEKKATTVPPGVELKIRYSGSDPKTLQASMQTQDGTFHGAEIKDGVVKAPLEPGVYYYAIHGFWKKGDSAGTFKIEVKP
ncbi:hypothetical protein [Cohnella sp. GCM10027633]|uniref:hypothetical protein n=1 Tax=unclassified Cohnella TaxID=2636738 RepID=UPI003630F513